MFRKRQPGSNLRPLALKAVALLLIYRGVLVFFLELYLQRFTVIVKSMCLGFRWSLERVYKAYSANCPTGRGKVLEKEICIKPYVGMDVKGWFNNGAFTTCESPSSAAVRHNRQGLHWSYCEAGNRTWTFYR